MRFLRTSRAVKRGAQGRLPRAATGTSFGRESAKFAGTAPEGTESVPAQQKRPAQKTEERPGACKPRARRGPAKALTDEEVRRVFAVAAGTRYAERNTALLMSSIGLGLRVSEIGALRVGHVLDERGQVRDEFRVKGKGARVRPVYPSPRVRRAFAAYAQWKRASAESLDPEAPFFTTRRRGGFARRYRSIPSPAGGPPREYVIDNSLQKLFRTLYATAGIDGASSHSGRRTFATRLLENGADMRHLQKLLGHRYINTTAEYVEANPEILKRLCANAV